MELQAACGKATLSAMPLAHTTLMSSRPGAGRSIPLGRRECSLRRVRVRRILGYATCGGRLGNSRMNRGLRRLMVIIISIALSLAALLCPLDDPSYAAENAVVRV